jgi:uncharacterized protein HemX
MITLIVLSVVLELSLGWVIWLQWRELKKQRSVAASAQRCAEHNFKVARENQAQVDFHKKFNKKTFWFAYTGGFLVALILMRLLMRRDEKSE